MINSIVSSKKIKAVAKLTLIGLLALPLINQLKANSAGVDPLPSWTEGQTKNNILSFINKVTDPESPDFVPKTKRLATFDNDGTLWAEMPVVQLMFVAHRLKQMSKEHPEWTSNPAVQAVLNGNIEYFIEHGENAIAEVTALTHSGMTQKEFQLEVEEFFKSAKHPKFGVVYTKTAYQPMIELLNHLRNQGFSTWINSGGGTEFMRVIVEPTYGIKADQVIGSIGGLSFEQRNEEWVLVKMPKLLLNNDKQNKPVGISIQTGKNPIFAAGNVRNGGDIAHLTYSNSNRLPNFQLLINHDDPEREFAYKEPGDSSLKAAKQQGWTVVNIKEDWQEVFSF